MNDQYQIDYQLVRSLSRGNLTAFKILFKKYGGHLYSFAYGYYKNKEDARELVQEVFTIVWEKRGDLKAGQSFKSYLFTISFNIIRKHYRDIVKMEKYFNREKLIDIDLQTAEKVDHDSLYQFIRLLADQLPDKRKEVFIKSRIEGKSIKEISEELKLSHKTVENHLTVALKFMRKCILRESLAVSLFFVLFFY